MKDNEIIILKNDSTIDMIEEIKKQIIIGSKIPLIQQIGEQSKNLILSQQLEFIFQYSYDLAVFRLSPNNRQQLRTVKNIIRTGFANCTGYVELIGSILYYLKIPFNLRLIDLDNSGYSHIYIESQGFILDACIGQKQDDTDTKENRPTIGQFNNEVNYYKKKDFNMLTVVNGTRTKRSRNKVNGYFDQAGAAIGDLLGDECSRECDMRYLSSPVARRECKAECDLYNPNLRLPDIYGGNIGADAQQTMMYAAIGLGAIYLMTREK